MWDSATIEPMGNSVQRKTSVDVNRSSADAMTTSSPGRVPRGAPMLFLESLLRENRRSTPIRCRLDSQF